MEDVNFPLDQSQVTSALRGLQEARDESSRPRRLEDSEEEFRNAETRDEEGADQTAQAERTVIAEDRVDVTEQAQQQDQTITDRVAENQEVEIQDQTTAEEQEGVAEETLQPLEVAREFGVDPRGGVPSAAEQVEDGFRSGNDAADPNRIDEVQNASRVDSVAEGADRGNEEAVELEQ